MNTQHHRAYIRISPDLIVNLLQAGDDSLAVKRDNGQWDVISTNGLPKGTKAVRGWIGDQGDIFLLVEHDEFPLVPDGSLESYVMPTMTAKSGYTLERRPVDG